MSETHFREDQNQESIDLDGFLSWRVERSGLDKRGGGLCLYYHQSLTAHCWVPTVPPHLASSAKERQWLLLPGPERLAFLHVYIACQTNQNDGYIEWNEKLFSLITMETIRLRRDGFSVLAMGDFNSRVGQIPGLEQNHPGLNKNTPMFMNFIQQANLVIINTLPVARGLFSRFMGDSSESGTLLDYGLIDGDSVSNVTSFVIDENARYAAGTDHALLVATLTCSPRTSLSWNFQEAIKFNFSNGSNFTSFQKHLDDAIANVHFNDYSCLSTPEMLPHLNFSLKESGKKAFGIKIKKYRKGRKLSRPIIEAIKSKSKLSQELGDLQAQMPPVHPHVIAALRDKLSVAKLNVKNMIADHKISKVHHIRSKVLANDPSRRKFWRFISSRIKSAGAITGLYDSSRTMVFEQDQIEAAVLDHFGRMFLGRSVPIYDEASPEDQDSLLVSEIDAILGSGSWSSCDDPAMHEQDVCRPFSASELDSILSNLSDGKASGHDDIPLEFLKHSTSKFRHYLLIFLNKILHEGVVPEQLNKGKCVLVYKVWNMFSLFSLYL